MSSRALRKAQRQLEEQQALQQAKEVKEVKASEEPEEAEDERSHTLTKNTKKSMFELLNESVQEDSESEDEAAPLERDKPTTSVKPVETQAKLSSKKKKKKKGKVGAKAKGPVPKEADDIDAALKLLANSSKPRQVGQSTEPMYEEVCRLLSVNTQNLHVFNEMRRLFGRDAIEAERRAPQDGRVRRQGQRPGQETGNGFPAVSLRRNIFIQGKEEWPRATTGGLGMEIVSRHPSDGTIEYRFVHSTTYQESQREYEIAVASMDPQRLIILLQQNRYHIATLLQVSEIAKHERAHAESGDFLERALFSFGRAVHSTFSNSLAQGKARLDFNRPENREFFLAVWRYIQNLSMRSTWRTVYEWAKLLLSLAPGSDPYCLCLLLDQYALRARQPQHYLNLIATQYFERVGPSSDDWWFADHKLWSTSLCYLQTDRLEEARTRLLPVINKQPWIAHRLFKELDLDPIPPALWSYHEAPTPRHILFTALYCTRAKDLWNTPEAKSLLVSVATQAKPEPDEDFPETISVDEARHVYLTENDQFIRLLAACEFNDGDAHGPGNRPTYDPFPPRDNLQSYDPKPVSERGFAAPGIQALGPVQGARLRELVREIERLQMGGGAEGVEGEEDAEGEEMGFDDMLTDSGDEI